MAMWKTNPPPPCWENGEDCKKRRVGCQPSCPKYKAFREKLDAIHREEEIDKRGAAFVCDTVYAHRKAAKNTEGGKRILAQR